MHDYAGDPSDWPEAVQLIDDSDPPNASNFNVGPQGGADRGSWLYARMPHLCQNWQPAVAAYEPQNLSSSEAIYFGAAVWNATIGSWIVILNNQQTGYAWAFLTNGLDGGSPSFWLQIGSGAIGFGAPFQVVTAAVDPNGVMGWAGAVDSATNTVTIHSVANIASAWTLVRTVTTADEVAMATFGDYLVYYANGILSSTDNQGSTWSDYPTGIAAGANQLVAGPNAIVAAGGTTDMWASTDGVAWTASSFSAGANTATIGLAWDNVRGLFVAIVNQTVTPFTVQVWTSPDGITWTHTSSGPSGQIVSGFAIAQGEYVCTLADLPVTGQPSNQMYSLDGGVTWYLGAAAFPTNLAVGQYYSRPQVAASPDGFCAWNSLWARFSDVGGILPATL
jgi:hypothetical protein